MNARFQGGPLHNKVRVLGLNEQGVFEVQRMQKKTMVFDPYASLSPIAPMPQTERGRYYRVPERDKQGNIIMAWAGWR